MKRIIFTLIVLGAFVAPLLAATLNPPRSEWYKKPGPLTRIAAETVIDADAITDGSSFSENLNVGGLNQLSLFICIDWAAATKVYGTCYAYLFNDSNAYVIQSLDSSNPEHLASYDNSFEKTVSGDKCWTWNFPINYDYVNCTFSADDSTTDTITVKARLGGI